jgi:hypothetical protein
MVIIEIRKARPDESETLTQIAHAAKRYWGYPEQWITLWSDELTITPEAITYNERYVAIDAGKMIGFYDLLRLARR